MIVFLTFENNGEKKYYQNMEKLFRHEQYNNVSVRL